MLDAKYNIYYTKKLILHNNIEWLCFKQTFKKLNKLISVHGS